jgi:hypothetical protein
MGKPNRFIFRAWDTEGKSMHLMAEIEDDRILCLGGSYQRIYMQSTGLLDKNGIEIFEGDILQDRRWSHDQGVVRYDEGAYRVDYAEDEGNVIHVNECSIIIGNIYENPELLPDKSGPAT